MTYIKRGKSKIGHKCPTSDIPSQMVLGQTSVMEPGVLTMMSCLVRPRQDVLSRTSWLGLHVGPISDLHKHPGQDIYVKLS